MNHAGTIPVQALLEHHDFVRRLARSLVRDDATADDLAQDAWLVALQDPPRDAQSLRGWFASVVRSRATNLRRSEDRRIEREASIARTDEDDTDARRIARLETGQSVVAAVLALEEPYRSVVLLAYYEGLLPAEIARRRGVPAGTVRSQLSRGHALLREKLDRRFGERRTWLAALAPLAGGASRLARASWVTGKMLAWTGALAGLALVAPFAWQSWRSASSSSVATARPTDWRVEAALLVALAEPSSGRRSVGLEVEPRESLNVAPAEVQTPPEVDVSKFSLDELLVLAEHTQNLVRERVLLQSGDWPEALRPLAARKDTGLCWLLPRERFPFEAYSPLGIRGGGAYWSFTLRTHDYDQMPDLGFEPGYFLTNFYGGHMGWLTELDVATLADVPTHPSGAPKTWSASMTEQWAALWREQRPEASSSYPQFRAALDATGLKVKLPVRPNGVYAVRSIHPDRAADSLSAFQIVERHDGAVRIAWRTLNVFQQPDGPRRMADAPPTLVDGPPPAWLSALDVAGLLRTLSAIQRAGQAKLFTVQPELVDRYERFAAQANSGLERLLQRAKYVRVVEKRGGGHCWSFATRDHEYDNHTDLYLEAEMLVARGGWLLDCGEVPVEQVATWGRNSPSTWGERERDAWNFAWDARTVPRDGDPKRRGLNAADLSRAADLELRRTSTASIGHSYLLRGKLDEDHDAIVVFEVMQIDETGITIAWRKLADFSDE